jgi:hypothetical protein
MSVDPSSSATSKSPVVTKILIDLSEYNRLIDLKLHLDNQEKKLFEQLHSSVHNQQKGEGESSESEKVRAETNSITSQPENNLSKNEIVTDIINLLEKRYGLVLPAATSQSGTGSCH